MMRLLIIATLLAPLPAVAEETMVECIVGAHILPRFEALAERSARLAATAQETCAPDAPGLCLWMRHEGRPL